MQNKYIKHSHISEKKFREILRYFCCDETANKTSVYTNISRNTINKIFDKIRQKIFLAHTILLPHNSFILGQEEKFQKKVYLLNLNWTNLILFIYVNGIRGKKGRGAPQSDIIEKHLFLDY